MSFLDPALLDRVAAIPPPDGKISNFEHPEIDGSNGRTAIIAGSILAATTVVVVALRLYTRNYITKAVGWDDYATVAALIGALGFTGLVIYAETLRGMGVHQWNVSAETVLKQVPYYKALPHVSFVAIFLSKLCLAALFLRIFNAKPILRYLIYAGIAYISVVFAVGLLGQGLSCPQKSNFDWLDCSKKELTYNLVIGCLNLASDIYLLVLPIMGISMLQMQKGRKLGIMTVFLTGFIAIAASVAATVQRHLQISDRDSLWHVAATLTFSMVEIDATILVACFPVLPSLFKGITLPAYLIKLKLSRGTTSGISRFKFKESGASSVPPNNQYSQLKGGSGSAKSAQAQGLRDRTYDGKEDKDLEHGFGGAHDGSDVSLVELTPPGKRV